MWRVASIARLERSVARAHLKAFSSRHASMRSLQCLHHSTTISYKRPVCIRLLHGLAACHAAATPPLHGSAGRGSPAPAAHSAASAASTACSPAVGSQPLSHTRHLPAAAGSGKRE